MDFKKFFKDKKNVALTILSVLLIGSFSAQGTKNHELTQAEAKIEQLNQEIDNTKSDLIDSQEELSDFKEENAKYIELGKKEFQILEMLILNEGKSIDKEKFIEKIWGYDTEAEYNTIEVYVSFLRKKFDAVGAKTIIKSIRGIGYTLGTQND